MHLLVTSASVEIQTDDLPSSKDLHFLRQRLQEAINEMVPNILEEYGILTENPHAVHVEPFEVEGDQS